MAPSLRLCTVAAAAAPLAAHAQGSTMPPCAPVGGQGSACQLSTPVEGEHLLLQLGGGRSSTMVAALGPQDVGSTGCSGMPDVKRKCSSNACKVLAGDMVGLTCSDFCKRSGRTCIAAWEEVQDDCKVKQTLRCDESYGSTSDLLCECAPDLFGPAMRVLAVSSSQLVWSDEFGGHSLDTSKWNVVKGGGGFGNNERQHYTDHSENLLVQDGVLHITAKCQDYGKEHFTSAKLTTKNIASWGPGHRVEVRAKVPSAEGTWPAIWMLPVEKAYGDWPRSGEIDIMESVGCSPNKIFGTVHTQAYNHMRNSQAYGSKSISVSEWHTYSLEWEEQGLQWFVDGELFGTFAPTHRNHERWPFSKDFYLILNLAVGGAWGGSCLKGGMPSCAAGSAFHNGQVMEVDYARVYRL